MWHTCARMWHFLVTYAQLWHWPLHSPHIMILYCDILEGLLWILHLQKNQPMQIGFASQLWHLQFHPGQVSRVKIPIQYIIYHPTMFQRAIIIHSTRVILIIIDINILIILTILILIKMDGIGSDYTGSPTLVLPSALSTFQPSRHHPYHKEYITTAILSNHTD